MYEDRTAEAIRAEICADIQAETGASPVTGGFIDTMVGRLAVEHAKVYSALNAAIALIFPDEDSGAFLDLHGEAYHNLERRTGSKARAAMTFSGTAGTVIPAGTVFVTSTGLEFATEKAVTLNNGGMAGGYVQAAEVGARYNVGADELTKMYVALAGLDEWHNAAASGGSDVESDGAYYARIDEKRKRPPTSGNVYHYRQWALSVPGVGAVKVIPLADGAGTVGVHIVGEDMTPAGAETVARVSEVIAANRPIGPTVTVQAPRAVPITIVARVELAAGGAVAAIQSAFVDKVREYLGGLVERKYAVIYAGKDEDTPYKVVYNRLAALLMDVEGVSNYVSLTVNGVAGDATIAADAVPVLGEVTVT